MSSWSPPLTLRGTRLGIVIGTAVALLGIGVGGAMAGSTTNPYVFVANPPSSPVPVAVTNQGSAQTVTGTVNVGNFPTTQSVSGTVNVGNLPTTQDVHVTNSSIVAGQPLARTVYGNSVSIDAGGNHTYDFGGTINVREVIMDGQGNSDSFTIWLNSSLQPTWTTASYSADGTFTEHLDLAIPAQSITVLCRNAIESCDGTIAVIGQ